jgi:hypothetical protein
MGPAGTMRLLAKRLLGIQTLESCARAYDNKQ